MLPDLDKMHLLTKYIRITCTHRVAKKCAKNQKVDKLTFLRRKEGHKYYIVFVFIMCNIKCMSI